MAKRKIVLQENEPSLPIKAFTKSSVWGIQENEVIQLWEGATKDIKVRENIQHYLDIFKSAFLIEEVKDGTMYDRNSYEKRGYEIAQIDFGDGLRFVWAIKKRPIIHVTDLTYENIRYISIAKLIDLLDHNFGGGWGALSYSTQNIILSVFDISTITLPKDRLHKKGGVYDKNIEDGFDVLEVPKGNWIEAIFVKEKSKQD